MGFPPVDQMQTITLSAQQLENSNVVGFNSRDIRSRPFNLLRSQLSKRMGSNGWRLIGITSATPAAGKSFMSVNLAAALSRLTDRMVYLVDFDLRRGSVSENLGINPTATLDQYLTGGDLSLGDFCYKVEGNNLVILPCHPVETSSAEMLVGDRFREFVAALRALPDNAIVLCDLPPVFANDDTMMVMEHLDAYLLIIEQGVTTSKQVRSTIDILQPQPCAGALLNRYDGTFGDPYGYGYGRDGYSKYYSS